MISSSLISPAVSILPSNESELSSALFSFGGLSKRERESEGFFLYFLKGNFPTASRLFL